MKKNNTKKIVNIIYWVSVLLIIIFLFVTKNYIISIGLFILLSFVDYIITKRFQNNENKKEDFEWKDWLL